MIFSTITAACYHETLLPATGALCVAPAERYNEFRTGNMQYNIGSGNQRYEFVQYSRKSTKYDFRY
jgi:hypothetical protein